MKRHLLLLLGAATTLGGCDNALSPDGSALNSDDAQVLATELDALGDAMMNDVLVASGASFALAPSGIAASSAPEPVNVTFNRTATCPAGGQVSVAGTITGTRDRETRTAETQTSSTKTLTDCAVRRRNGTTITTNGSIAHTAHKKTVNGLPSGLQTQTHKGSFSFTTSAGRSGTCDIDITSTFDPATRTHTIKGTNCRRTIDLTVTRN